MGSGKGKTRRARIVVARAQPAPLVFDRGIWDNFVETSGVKTTKLLYYYLGRDPAAWTNEGYLRATLDMFADAVSVGAIVLPPGCSVDDFEFSINSEGHRPRVAIALTSNPATRQVLFTPAHTFSKNNSMSNWYVNNALEGICYAAEKLLYP